VGNFLKNKNINYMIPKFDEFVNEAKQQDEDKIIADFKKQIDRDGHDKHDIESAYEDTIKKFSKKYSHISFQKIFDELPEPTFESKDADLNESNKYYDIVASTKSGFDLYYYDEKSKKFDIEKGNFKTMDDAKEQASKDGYEKKPMHWRD
jgi:hypothetical protein